MLVHRPQLFAESNELLVLRKKKQLWMIWLHAAILFVWILIRYMFFFSCCARLVSISLNNIRIWSIWEQNQTLEIWTTVSILNELICIPIQFVALVELVVADLLVSAHIEMCACALYQLSDILVSIRDITKIKQTGMQANSKHVCAMPAQPLQSMRKILRKQLCTFIEAFSVILSIQCNLIWIRAEFQYH